MTTDPDLLILLLAGADRDLDGLGVLDGPRLFRVIAQQPADAPPTRFTAMATWTVAAASDCDAAVESIREAVAASPEDLFFRLSPITARLGEPRSSTPGPNERLMVALTNPVAGQEDRFNQWYTGTHVPDVLSVDGIASAQRFRVTRAHSGDAPEPAYRYVALYDVDPGGLAAAQAGIAKGHARGHSGSWRLTRSAQAEFENFYAAAESGDR